MTNLKITLSSLLRISISKIVLGPMVDSRNARIFNTFPGNAILKKKRKFFPGPTMVKVFDTYASIQQNSITKIFTLSPPAMNLQNSIQRPYLLQKVLVYPFSWIGLLPLKIPSCAPAEDTDIAERMLHIYFST